MELSVSVVEKAIEYIQEIFQGKADGHGVDHTMRVYHTALKIANQYDKCDLELVSLSSLLHDVDDHKLFQTKDNANT